MNDPIALRERYITKLHLREDYRRSFQEQADLDQANNLLKAQGLERFSTFDRDRAATMPEMGLQFQARAAPETQEHNKHALELVTKLPPFLHRMLSEFDTAIQTGKNAEDVSATLGKRKYHGSRGKTFAEGASSIFIPEANLAATFADKACAKDMNCRLHTQRNMGHEIGHAINAYLSTISNNQAFLAAYDKDVKNLNKMNSGRIKNLLLNPAQDSADVPIPQPRKKTTVYMTYFGLKHYLTQKEGGNHEEIKTAAAEVFAETLSDYINKDRYKNDPDFNTTYTLSRYFPESSKFVEKLMFDLEKYYTFAPKPLVPY